MHAPSTLSGYSPQFFLFEPRAAVAAAELPPSSQRSLLLLLLRRLLAHGRLMKTIFYPCLGFVKRQERDI